MTDLYELELRGCSPDPLMSYLKALGVFRLVSEQKDGGGRAYWKNDTFYLRSALDRDALMEFFLNEYKPTPIVSPWNGGSGFYPKGSRAAREAIQAIDTHESPHLDEYREVVTMARKVLDDMDIIEKPSKSERQDILARYRNWMPDIAVPWIDAAYVLTTSGPEYMPLLGTGGNDGNLDFSVNFIKNLIPALTGLQIGKKPPKRFDSEDKRKGWLSLSIFDHGDTPLVSSAVGQFNPGSAGGPNASVGFSGGALLNPWDYVLMFEGALMFAGAAARRLSSQGAPKAVFPFTVDNSAAGYATASDPEYGDSARAEFWAPLWERPASLHELERLMSEGRAQLGRGQADSGSDFARAVSGLGTERGVSQFQRYGFVKRNGKSYLAAPLSRFHIRSDDSEISQGANVLFDLDGWLNRLRRVARGNKPPAGLGIVLRQVDKSIIEFCQRGSRRDLQDVLIAVGQIERWLSRSGLSKDPKNPVNPLSSLSPKWARYADDCSAEFRLARAMASIQRKSKDGKRVGPIRENLEPVEGTTWNDGSVSCVWTSGDPFSNMLSVLQRRCLEGRMQGLDYPPLDSACSANLEHVVTFLDHSLDYQRIVDLAFPLSFLSYESGKYVSQDTQFDLPHAYAVMKLTLLTEKFRCPGFSDDEKDIKMEPRMLAMLGAGRVEEAYQVAHRRLRASGLRPISASPSISNREDGRRLAAALLFPVDKGAYRALAERALRKTQDKNS